MHSQDTENSHTHGCITRMTGVGAGAGGYEGVRGAEGDFVCVERAEGGVACEAKESAGRYEEEAEEEGKLEGLKGGESVGSGV